MERKKKILFFSKRVILTFIFSMMLLLLSAKQFSLISFQPVPADFQAQRNSITDMNMEYCAALKVEAENYSEINLKQKVYKRVPNADNSEYLYFSASETQLAITAPGHEPLIIPAPENGFKKGMVYYAKLETIDALAQPAETINDSIPTAPVTENVDPTQWPVKEERIGIDFNITYVEMFDNQLIIYLELLNNKEDREIQILGWYGNKYTSFYDDAGNEYKPSQTTLANQSAERDVKSTLITGIPNKGYNSI